MPAVGLGLSSPESISFHIITALAIISYYRGVVTDPGRIPPTAEWEKENGDKKLEGLRFCSREKKWKPERTHYCSALGRNVLRMDHMCPWLANCVGYFNHKYFMLFILYATVATGWTTVSVGHLLALSSAGLLTKSSALSAAQVFFLTEGLCISSLVSLILAPFTGFHLWLVARNKTTLEYCEKSNPSVSYDFGVVYNFCQIFGYNPLLWFLPIQTAPGDGLHFDKRKISVSDEQSEDEEEKKIRIQMEAQLGITSGDLEDESSGETCCMRRWDTDSPLIGEAPSSWWDAFVMKCCEVNAFTEKCQIGFGNIMSGRSTPKTGEENV